jgi:hypothetical protein
MKQQKNKNSHQLILEHKFNRSTLIYILMFNNRIIKTPNSLQTTAKS